MLPSADKLYGDADFIFQQDLAPAHTAKGTKSIARDGAADGSYCALLQCLYCFCLFFLFFVSQTRSALPGMNC